MARLDPDAPTSVELPLPTQNQAREIIIAHLDHFRINPDDTGTIKPFTEDSLDSLVSNSQHPRALLSSAARVVSRAVEKKIVLIDVETVKEAMDSTPPPTTDFTEGLDEAM